MIHERDTMSTTEQELLRRARRRVGMKTGFLVHLGVYVLVNLGLVAMNLLGSDRPWHWWPLAGWGLGLAIHGLVTLANLRGEGLRRRMLEREVERLRRESR
jgi:hypothetical protein